MAKKPHLMKVFEGVGVLPGIHLLDDPSTPPDTVLTEQQITATLKDLMPMGGFAAGSSEDHVYGLMIDLFAQYYAADHTVAMSQLAGPQGGPYELIFFAYPHVESSLTPEGNLDETKYRPDLMQDIATMWADLSVVAQADMLLGKEHNNCWFVCASAPAWLRVLERLVEYKEFPAPEIERSALMLTRLPALRQAVTQEFGAYVPPGQPRTRDRHRAPGEVG